MPQGITAPVPRTADSVCWRVSAVSNPADAPADALRLHWASIVTALSSCGPTAPSEYTKRLSSRRWTMLLCSVITQAKRSAVPVQLPAIAAAVLAINRS